MHKLNLRVPVDLIEAAKAEAKSLHISLNSYILQALESHVAYTRGYRERQEQRRERQGAPAAARPLGVPAKVGRNDPCPCGSGRKAKACHPALC